MRRATGFPHVRVRASPTSQLSSTAQSSAASEQRNAARIMRALVRIGFADLSESDAYQSVLADLRAIEREIPKDLLDGEMISKGIVVTAFDCSPRLMLTIGDVVNTGCCLNYQSGARINVLPAYVVDANIQALVSWQLKQSHFASVRDYKAVLNAFVAGRPATAAFDGDRLMFRFTVPEGERGTKIEHAEPGLCASASDRTAGQRTPRRFATPRASRRARICPAPSVAAADARQSRRTYCARCRRSCERSTVDRSNSRGPAIPTASIAMRSAACSRPNTPFTNSEPL